MLNINITHFRKNIFDLLEQTIRFNEPINVTTKNGNAVVLSEEDYNGLMETLHLSSIPGMKEKIVDGLKTPLSECVPESEVEWLYVLHRLHKESCSRHCQFESGKAGHQSKGTD